MYYALDTRNTLAICLVNDLEVMWQMGEKFTSKLPKTLKAEVVRDLGTGPMPDIKDMISDGTYVTVKALEVLRKAGVANFDAYDVVVLEKKKKFANYKVLNVIGTINLKTAAAANKKNTAPEEVPILLRMADGTRRLVVNDALKRVMEQARFKGVEFSKL